VTSYSLQVSTASDFSIINYSSSTALNSAAMTLAESSYTWRVNAVDNALNYTTSTLRFTVVVFDMASLSLPSIVKSPFVSLLPLFAKVILWPLPVKSPRFAFALRCGLILPSWQPGMKIVFIPSLEKLYQHRNARLLAG